MKYLTYKLDGADHIGIEEIEWKNLKFIQQFWFGDDKMNCKLASDVFPNTEKARAAMETVLDAYTIARRTRDSAIRLRREVAKAKNKGEFDEL